MKKVILALFLTSLTTTTVGQDKKTEAPSKMPVEDADTILKKADEIRNPSTSYRMEVTVDSSADDSSFRFEISIGGKDASVIKTLQPGREIGKNYLMINEDMWAYIPNIKRAVRVTLNQKLTGQAANGDISRMRWYGDYDAKVESQDQQHWVLMLDARRRGLTYDKIRVWIDKSNYRPIKGQYLTRQEKVLKNVEFTEYKTIAGNVRPTKIIIKNANKEDDYSILQIREMATANFPQSLFTQNSLK